MTPTLTTPPAMAGWNLALRFGLELTALAGLAVGAWRLASGPLRPAAAVATPVIAAVIWGVFNVVGDPSRSGHAPVEVPGWVRLGIELAILGGGAAALAATGRREVALAYAVVVAIHYAASWPRVQWLLHPGT